MHLPHLVPLLLSPSPNQFLHQFSPNSPKPFLSLLPAHKPNSIPSLSSLSKTYTHYLSLSGTLSLSLTPNTQMEEQQLLRSGGGGASRLHHLTTIPNSRPITLTLPLTRYTTRFLTGDRPILLCGSSEPPSDGYDDDQPSGGDCGYSKPFVVLDVIWNLAFVVVSVVVLLSTFRERPSTPLRVWICGYALQCFLHVGFVYLEYQRRNRDCNGGGAGVSSSRSRSRIVKRLESVNMVISSFWWVLGFCWIVVGGQALLQDSPRLYWLAVIFLAFDVFFMIFCIGMACIIFFALFCCIPIVAIAYAMTIREGASEDDIRILPKFRFRQANTSRPIDNEKKQEIVGATVLSSNNNSISELALHPEDSECCICLSQYVDGAELYTLPCNHHFHCECISRWLRINATCPLCKFNILKGDMLV